MRVIVFLLLISIGLIASMFDRAVVLYENGSYIQAYEKFYILYNKDKSDKKVALYLSKCLYNLGEYEDAKLILKSLQKSGYVNKEISKYLKKISNINKLHKFFFLASFGLTYDDNVKNNTYEPTIDYGTLTLANDTHKIDDTFASEMLFVSHSYSMPSYEMATWSDAILFYNRNGLKHSDQNMFFTSLESGPKIQKNDYIIQPQILLSNLYYGGMHYMYSYGFGAKVIKDLIDSKLKANLNFSLKKDKYTQDKDKTKNDNTFLFG